MILCASLASASDHLPSPISIDDDRRYDIARNLSVLIDTTGTYDISDVQSEVVQSQFVNYEGEYPNLGFINRPVWISFELKNPNEPETLILTFNNSQTDSIELYEETSDGGHQMLRAGEGMKKPDISFRHRRFVFILTIPSGSSRYFARIYSPRSAMTILLTLWQSKAFAEYERRVLLIYGFFAGPTLFFALYFCFMALKLREPMEFWFAIFLIMLGILTLLRSGVLQDFVGPLSTGVWNAIAVVALGSAVSVGILMLRLYYDLNQRSRFFDIVFAVLQWLALLFIPLSYVSRHVAHGLGYILFLALPLLVTYYSFSNWKKGNPNSGLIAIGFLAVNSTVIIEFLRTTGIIKWNPIMHGTLPTALWWSLVFYSVVLVRRIQGYKTSSQNDALTGLANRATFSSVLAKEWLRSCRNQTPISMLMIDIDHFKRYNDSYGHRAGDSCIKIIADFMRKSASRPGDLCARYGGEEFCVILPDTDLQGAGRVAESIQGRVHDYSQINQPKALYPFTVSIGVSTFAPSAADNPQSLIENADRALYDAKTSGRDKTVVSELSVAVNE